MLSVDRATVGRVDAIDDRYTARDANPLVADPHGATTLRRLAVVVIACAIAGLPLLRPPGPGNSAPVDLVVVLAFGVTALAAIASRARIRLPYVIPVALTVAAGAVGALLHEPTTEAVVTLGQDLLVFLFAAAVVNACRSTRELGAVLRVWALSATGWAGLMLVAVAIGDNSLAGITARTGSRASLTFGDANLAASYFAISLLVVIAARTPRHQGLRWCACAVLATAVVLTGSLGGMLGLGIALALLGVQALIRRVGTMPALAITLLLAPVVVVGVRSAYESLVARAADPNSALHDSVGRVSSSSAGHDRILGEDLRLLASASLLGNGPTSTKGALAREQLSYVKEAHNDYLATAIERGALGVVALVLLVGSLVVRSRRALARTRESAIARAVPNVAALIAALVTVACTGMFYEVLHFRQVWALFGVVAAIGLVQDR
jgi:O-antigen ligase